MKICIKCGCELNVNKNWHEQNKKTKYYVCVNCNKLCAKKYYVKNEKKLKAYRFKNRKRIIATSKKYNKITYDWFRKFKESQGCALCNYNKCGDALVYHHVEPKERIKNIDAPGIYHGHQITYNELLKCVLLCSNCHKEIHYLIRH
jgi:hypothetical protein